MRYELVSVANGERLLGTAVPVDPKALKRASHRVSDAVYEKILGVRGAFATRIAYVAVDGPVTKRSYRLVVSDADGANERIVFGSPDPIMSPAWSPDGRSIAYVSFHTGLAAIYVQTLSTGAQVRFPPSQASTAHRAIRRTARNLRSRFPRRDGNVDVYVLTLATQELKRLTDDPAIDTEPSWAPDGRSLYFTSDRAGGPAGLQRRRRTRRTAPAHHLRRQLQRTPARIAGRTPARGRHAGPRRIPHRGRGHPARRTAGAERRPARRVAVVRAERRGYPLHEPGRRARYARNRLQRRAASSNRSPQVPVSCGRLPGRRSSTSGRDAPLCLC